MSTPLKIPLGKGKGFFISSMSLEEAVAINDNATECLKNGDRRGCHGWLAKIPLAPTIAMQIVQNPSLGKKHLLECNYNLVDAEAYYGKGWLEKY